MWTEQLVKYSDQITALDASSEKIPINRGFQVRVFKDVDSAAEWLLED